MRSPKPAGLPSCYIAIYETERNDRFRLGEEAAVGEVYKRGWHVTSPRLRGRADPLGHDGSDRVAR